MQEVWSMEQEAWRIKKEAICLRPYETYLSGNSVEKALFVNNKFLNEVKQPMPFKYYIPVGRFSYTLNSTHVEKNFNKLIFKKNI